MFWRKPSPAPDGSQKPSDLAQVAEPFPPRGERERQALLGAIRTTPLAHGPWRHFKKLYKTAEAAALSGEFSDAEVLAALLARLDGAAMQAAFTWGVPAVTEAPADGP